MLQTTIAPQLEATTQQVLTDAQLLALIARGENWALSEIYDRYSRLVFSLALKILNDRASAEEIVQQVFTIVWRSARDYRAERGKFSSWVMSITRHQCIDELRRRRVRPVTQLGDAERDALVADLLRQAKSARGTKPDAQPALDAEALAKAAEVDRHR